MKSSLMLLAAALLLACSFPNEALAAATGQCHDVDMYGIYKVCDPPEPAERQHEERPQAIVQPVYVPVYEPFTASFPASNPQPPPPSPAADPIPAPPPATK